MTEKTVSEIMKIVKVQKEISLQLVEVLSMITIDARSVI